MQLIRQAVVFALVNTINCYRLLVSPLIGYPCRYYPSCSAYAKEAVVCHGSRRGLWLTLRRLSKCHPWGGCGYDPVPDK
jgi:uncharacterized protein